MGKNRTQNQFSNLELNESDSQDENYWDKHDDILKEKLRQQQQKEQNQKTTHDLDEINNQQEWQNVESKNKQKSSYQNQNNQNNNKNNKNNKKKRKRNNKGNKNNQNKYEEQKENFHAKDDDLNEKNESKYIFNSTFTPKLFDDSKKDIEKKIFFQQNNLDELMQKNGFDILKDLVENYQEIEKILDKTFDYYKSVNQNEDKEQKIKISKKILTILQKISDNVMNDIYEKGKIVTEFLKSKPLQNAFTLLISSIKKENYDFQKEQKEENYEIIQKFLNIYDYFINNAVQGEIVFNIPDLLSWFKFQEKEKKNILEEDNKYRNLKQKYAAIEKIVLLDPYFKNSARLLQYNNITEANIGNFNYTRIKNMPKRDELLQNIQISQKQLTQNIIQGPHQSVEHLLNQHFHCLRENFVNSFKLVLSQAYQAKSFLNIDNSEVASYFYVYPDIKIQKIQVKQDIELSIYINKFSRNIQNIIKDFGKEKILQEGNIVLLMSHKISEKKIFQAQIYKVSYDEKYKNGAKVKLRMIPEPEKNYQFYSYEFIFNSIYDHDYIIMLEQQQMYESYIHFQNQLQIMSTVRFTQYTSQFIQGIDDKQKSYIYDNKIKLYLNQQNLQEGQEIEIQNRDFINRIKNYDLYQGQTDAIVESFQRNLQLVLGPPGCGKSYLGTILFYQILRFFKEQRQSEKRPIVIMSQTNTALDNFLEQILEKKYTNKLVRVGGQSTSEKLAKYTLYQSEIGQKVDKKKNKQHKQKNEENEEYLKNDEEKQEQKQEQKQQQKSEEKQQQKQKSEEEEQEEYTKQDLSYQEYNYKYKQQYQDNTNQDLQKISHQFYQNQYEIKSQLNDYFQRFQNQKTPNFQEYEMYFKDFDINFFQLFKKSVQEYFNVKIDIGRVVLEEIFNDLYSNLDLDLEEYTADFDNIDNQQYPIQFKILEIFKGLFKQDQTHKKSSQAINKFQEELKKNIVQKIEFYQQQGQEFEYKKKEYKQLKDQINKNSENIQIKYAQQQDINNIITQLKQGHLRFFKLNLQQKKMLEYRINLSVINKEKDKFLQQLQDLEKNKNRQKQIQSQKLKDLLNNQDVIGMTVTGGAKYNQILELIKPKVVIVEEAAQIIEGQLLASLPYTVQHLILIGDHHQLRPLLNDRNLQRKFNFDVSLFERMINNKIPYSILNEQTRMRPEIAKYVRLFYEKDEYQNHKLTEQLQPVKGVKENVFFWNIEDSEEQLANRSQSNEKEAQLALNLARYILLQGYSPDDITILSMYQGQITFLNKLISYGNPDYLYDEVNFDQNNNNINYLDKDSENNDYTNDDQEYSDNDQTNENVIKQKKTNEQDQNNNEWSNQLNDTHEQEKYQSDKESKFENQQNKIKEDKYFDLLKNVKISTVDKFQGQENKIIILTLVRSNDEDKIGFLVDKRRINVALSRAKNGLFVIGNFRLMNQSQNTLSSEENKWGDIISEAEQNQQLNDYFTIKCQKHDHETKIYDTNDFKKNIFGGCTKKKCQEIRKDCKHICQELCHSIEHSEIPCNEQIEQNCQNCGDRLKIFCFQKDTYKCQNQIEIVIQPCNHKKKIFCFERNENIECGLQCEKILKCGHKCEKICKETCSEKDCIQNVQIQLACGHVKQDVSCNISQTSKFQFECKQKCDKKLECGHQCQGDCHTCFQGTLHYPCKESKSEISPICGHKIEYNCSIPKPVCMKQFNKKVSKCKCYGNNNKQYCYELQTECEKKQCQFVDCKNKQKCKKKCYEICGFQKCYKFCDKKLNCGHYCRGVCCEKCPICVDCPISSSDQSQIVSIKKEVQKKQKNGKFMVDEHVLIFQTNCFHFFDIDQLDVEVEKQMNNPKFAFIQCPKCSTPFDMTKRYEKEIKKKWEERKKKFQKFYQQSQSKQQNQVKSVNKFKNEILLKSLKLYYVESHEYIKKCIQIQNEMVVVLSKFVGNDIQKLTHYSLYTSLLKRNMKINMILEKSLSAFHSIIEQFQSIIDFIRIFQKFNQQLEMLIYDFIENKKLQDNQIYSEKLIFKQKSLYLSIKCLYIFLYELQVNKKDILEFKNLIEQAIKNKISFTTEQLKEIQKSINKSGFDNFNFYQQLFEINIQKLQDNNELFKNEDVSPIFKNAFSKLILQLIEQDVGDEMKKLEENGQNEEITFDQMELEDKVCDIIYEKLEKQQKIDVQKIILKSIEELSEFQ